MLAMADICLESENWLKNNKVEHYENITFLPSGIIILTKREYLAITLELLKSILDTMQLQFCNTKLDLKKNISDQLTFTLFLHIM